MTKQEMQIKMSDLSSLLRSLAILVSRISNKMMHGVPVSYDDISGVKAELSYVAEQMSIMAKDKEDER